MAQGKAAHIASWSVASVTAFVLALSAWGGWLDPRVFTFVPGVLVIIFPIVAVASILVAICLALTSCWRQFALVAVALLASTPRATQLLPLGDNSSPTGNSPQLTVMTYNVAAFPRVAPGDTSDVMRTILDLNPDIVLIQEMMHASASFHYDEVPALRGYLPELNTKFPYRSYPYRDDVAILSKYPFSIDTIVPAQQGYDALSVYQDLEHYATLAFDIDYRGEKVRLISTHLHSYGLSNADKRLAGADTTGQFDVQPGSKAHGMSLPAKLNRAFSLRATEARQLRNAIDAWPGTIIVCGDFNDVAGSYAYNTVRGSDLRDAYTDGARGYAPTYSRPPMLVRIDHILYRGPITARATHVITNVKQSHTSSDHYPLITTFTPLNNNF